MLSKQDYLPDYLPDYLEATRRYKNKKLSGHERQRYHALLLVTKGYSYRETGSL